MYIPPSRPLLRAGQISRKKRYSIWNRHELWSYYKETALYHVLCLVCGLLHKQTNLHRLISDPGVRITRRSYTFREFLLQTSSVFRWEMPDRKSEENIHHCPRNRKLSPARSVSGSPDSWKMWLCFLHCSVPEAASPPELR